MADTKTTSGKAADDGIKPTAQEAMFFFAIVKHTKNKADIDWKGVAEEQGFKSADVAKVRFGQVKRKLGINSDASATANSAPRTPKKPTTPTAQTPGSKVKKSTGRSGAKGKKGIKAKEEDSEEEEKKKKKIKDEYQSADHSPYDAAAAEVQLQADMDACINADPFVLGNM